MTRLLLTGLLVVFVAGGVYALRDGDAEAAISCPAHANTAQELQFVSLLQAWRDSHISGSYPLTVSGPLNAAAAHYAEYLATHPGAGGHYAEPAYAGAPYPWAARAVDCGYPASIAAGGEGLAVVEASFQVNVGAQQALNIMTAEPGGGVWVPSNVGYPVKCVGVAMASSPDGRKVAWVTLIFATNSSCPQPGGGTPPTPPEDTPTATSTPTRTPSPTPTPTSTPAGRRAVAPEVVAGSGN